MEELKELQRMWQDQVLRPAPPLPDLREAFVQQRRRNVRIYFIKAAAAVIGLVCVGSVMSKSILSMAGLAVMAAGFAVFLAMEIRNRAAFPRIDFGTPPAAFVRQAAAKIRELEIPSPLQRFSLLAALLLGLNLVSAGSLSGDWPRRVFLHAGLSGWTLAAYWIGLKVRAATMRRQYRPMLDRLAAFAEPEE